MAQPEAQLSPGLHVVPVLLGQGRRLFEHLRADPVTPELVRCVSTPEVQHLRYRLVRQP